MSIKLYLEKDGAVVRKFSLHEGNKITVGKTGNQNTVDLDDAAVSRKHAAVSYSSGKAFVTDLGSTNLTLLNGTQLTPNQPYPLKNGDKIKFGKQGQYTLRMEMGQPIFSMQTPQSRQSGIPTDSGIIELMKNGNLIKSYSLSPGKKLVVGRPGFGNEIELDDNSVSRHHARIEYNRGQPSVLDMDSTNKTYVNGNILTPNQQVVLKNGDRVRVSGKGSYELKIRLKESQQVDEGHSIIQVATPQSPQTVIKEKLREPIAFPEQPVSMKRIERLQKQEVAPLVPFRKGSKWGFADASGIVMIPVIYDDIKPFHQGYAAIRSGVSWGFINESGNVIIPFKYEEVSNFEVGFEAFRQNGKWGFINKDGREIIFPKYLAVKDFKDGIALVSTNRVWGAINTQGHDICPTKYDSITDFEEGLARVSQSGRYGFISKDGKEVIPLKFTEAGNFSEGLTPVKFDDWQHAKYGYIDKTGKEAIAAKYSIAKEFTENLARVCFDKKWGFIDRKGNEKIPLQYKNAAPFSFGLAPIATSSFLWLEEKWGVIDKEGLEVVPCNYENAGFYAEEIAPIKLNGRWGFIDKFGNMLVQPRYEKLFLPDGSQFNNEKLLNYFEGGLIAVEINGKKGFIDSLGNEVVPPKFNLVKPFSAGIAYVELNGTGGYVDIKGKQFFE